MRAADVVVVGFGAAGAAAAVTAARRGADVLLLEKQPEDEHTPNTRMSGGVIMGVNDVDAAETYLDRCAGGLVPRAVSRAWAERAATLVDWLDEIGADLQLVRIGGAEQELFEGAHGVDCYMQGKTTAGVEIARDEITSLVAAGFGCDYPGRRTGRDLFASLKQVVEREARIEISWASPAKRLLRDPSSRVVGVETEAGERVGARHGVILTTGGYEYDARAKASFLKASPIYFYGNPGNTGDGVRMAQAVGADLSHMNQMIGRAIGHFVGPDGREYNFTIKLGPPGYLITDRYGARFSNEDPQAELRHGYFYHLTFYDPDAREYPRIPCYWFFDSRRMTAGMLTSDSSGLVGVGRYDWSSDNRKEVEQGWIAEGATIADAAARAGVRDPARAERTVEEYNEACRRGVDAFGRSPETLVPLDAPPYYCVALYPGGSNTCGGPRRNERAQVVDAFGEPIPGLYSAGELGSAIALLYPADGGNISEALCFGQIAAESALADA